VRLPVSPLTAIGVSIRRGPQCAYLLKVPVLGRHRVEDTVGSERFASSDEGDDPARVAAPRDGSKLAQVIELLRRADGATISDLTQASGWLRHTTRAALTGLRKRGYAVIRERIGAGDSVYRISDAPAHSGDRTVRQRDAMDGRGPKRKATQAA
jgi:hypothetical protein